MRRMIPLALIAAVVTGCGGSEAAEPAPYMPSTLTVGGTIAVPRSFIGASKECLTGGGYSDIKEGAQVVISDAAGATIALGRLEAGKVDETRTARCVFPFAVLDVPDGHQFYGVEISHRGRLQYTAEQVVMSLTLTLD